MSATTISAGSMSRAPGRILDAAVDAKVDRVVHGSTIGVYGMADEGPVHDRTPLFPDNIYGQTKLEGEHLARSYADRLKLAIVRISETFGPGDFRLLKLFKGIKSKKFFMVGKGEEPASSRLYR